MVYTLTRKRWAARYERLALQYPAEIYSDEEDNHYVKLWIDTANVELWRYIDNTDSYELISPKH
jgi:hypothetical protein